MSNYFFGRLNQGLLALLLSMHATSYAVDFDISLSQGNKPLDNVLTTERDTDTDQTIRVGDNEEGSFSFSTLVPLTNYALSSNSSSTLSKSSSSLTNPTPDSTTSTNTTTTSYAGSINNPDGSTTPTTVTTVNNSSASATPTNNPQPPIPDPNGSLPPAPLPPIPVSSSQSQENASKNASANAAGLDYKAAVSGFKVKPHMVDDKVHLVMSWQRAEANGQTPLAQRNLQSTVTIPLGQWIMLFGKKDKKNETTTRTVRGTSPQIWLKIDRVDDP